MKRRIAQLIALSALALVAAVVPARADGFISPYIGYNFGGNASCPHITGCTDKRLNAGVALGAVGGVLGFEEDFGYAKDFFGQAAGLDSSVLTVMSNLMITPKIGPVRPYLLAGIGLIKAHVALTPSSIFTTDKNSLGWDLGGGLMGLFGDHIGVRGDIRYIHSFQDFNVAGFTLSNPKLNFGRASAGLVLMF
jgi:opacity protein-like surface antigen